MADIQQNPGEALAADVAKVTSHTGVIGRIRNYFLTGLVVAGPLRCHPLADLVVRHLGGRLLTALIPPVYRPETYLPSLFRALA